MTHNIAIRMKRRRTSEYWSDFAPFMTDITVYDGGLMQPIGFLAEHVEEPQKWILVSKKDSKSSSKKTSGTTRKRENFGGRKRKKDQEDICGTSPNPQVSSSRDM